MTPLDYDNAVRQYLAHAREREDLAAAGGMFERNNANYGPRSRAAIENAIEGELRRAAGLADEWYRHVRAVWDRLPQADRGSRVFPGGHSMSMNIYMPPVAVAAAIVKRLEAQVRAYSGGKLPD